MNKFRSIVILKWLCVIYLMDWMIVSLAQGRLGVVITIVAVMCSVFLLFLLAKKIYSLSHLLRISFAYLMISTCGVGIIVISHEEDARYALLLAQFAEIERVKIKLNLQDCADEMNSELAEFYDPFSDTDESLRINKIGCYSYSIGPNQRDDDGIIQSTYHIRRNNCSARYLWYYPFGRIMCEVSFENHDDISVLSYSDDELSKYQLLDLKERLSGLSEK